MGEGSGRGSDRVAGQTFCRQSRVGSTFLRVGSGRVQEKSLVDNSDYNLLYTYLRVQRFDFL